MALRAELRKQKRRGPFSAGSSDDAPVGVFHLGKRSAYPGEDTDHWDWAGQGTTGKGGFEKRNSLERTAQLSGLQQPSRCLGLLRRPLTLLSSLGNCYLSMHRSHLPEPATTLGVETAETAAERKHVLFWDAP